MTLIKKAQERILELDVLRGLAAFSVLCFHYTTDYTVNYLPATPTLFQFPWGCWGVQLFFMISGFVIFMTLEKTKTLLDFVVSRFSRLYPCYWAAVILTFSAVSFFHLPGREISFHDALINTSMLQDWFGASRVDNVYWTLTVELSFYIVMGILFKTKMLKHIEILGLLWLVFMVWNIRVFLLIMHFHVPVWIKTTGLLRYGNLFFAGILFYNLKTKGSTWYRHFALLMCLGVQYIFREEINPFVVLGFFVSFYLFIYGKLSWIVNKPTVFLGTISYSLYLIHQNIGFIIMRYLYSLHLNAWLIFIIPTCCSILIASAITFGIEKPVMYLIRQNYKRLMGPQGE